MKFINIKSIIFIFCILFVCNSFSQEVEGGIVGETWIASAKKAEDLYKKLAYHDAIDLYKRLLKKKEDAKAEAQLGDCYRLIGDFKNADAAYTKAVAGADVAPETYLHQAEMKQILKDYDGAAAAYEKYLASTPNDVRAQNQLAACKNPAQFQQTANRYNISNLSINTKYFDFAPTYKTDGLYFSSDRDAEKAIGREHSWLGYTFFDMYYSKGEKTAFVKPSSIKKDGQGLYHDAAATFNSEGKVVYFTRNNSLKSKLSKSKDNVVKQGIFTADVDGKTWKNIKKFKYNNPEYDVAHPALSADGNTLYFASNMPGGKGGMDLSTCTKEGNDWSAPVNAEEFNTEGDEIFPSVDKNGTLYFASNGLGGLGGLDVFKSKLNSLDEFRKAQNIGAPINSSYDDFGVAFSKETNLGYFTSNRPEGKGSDDIWSFTDNGIDLEGVVVDALTKKPICKSDVEMLTNNINKGNRVTGCDGEFSYEVDVNKEYNFNVAADGYAPNNDVTATTKNVKPGETVMVTIPLVPIKPAGYLVKVVDKTTKKEIRNATVDVSSSTDITKYEQKITDNNGQVCYTILCGYDYLASSNAKGYNPNTQLFSSKEDCEKLVDCGQDGGKTAIVELERGADYDKFYDKDGNPIDSSTLYSGTLIELKDIYYDFDKWFIRKESEPQLNKVLKFMKENPDAIAEIGSHTDSRATDEYNNVLSQKRAQSVVDWLVKRGVSKNRLTAVGFGESKLRNDCSNDVKCSEYEHQRNRRTEFRIISGKVDVISLERLDMQVDPCTICPF
ncbi:MAG: OmpA family protein [Saprospirales bacterium]|nr:OmpA family protein [Saprospirales bacterium]